MNKNLYINFKIKKMGILSLFIITMFMLTYNPAYAADKVEGAVVEGMPLSNTAQVSDVKLSSIEIEPTDGNTVYDYLTEIESELIDFDKRNLLKKGKGAEYYLFEDCLEMAKKKHRPVEIAKDKVSLYRRKLIKAIRDLFPGLNFLYEHNLGFKLLKDDTIPGDHTNQQFRSEKWRMSLTQPVFKGGALWNKVMEERANLRAAQAEYDKVFFDLSVEVARAYFNYSKAKTMLSFKENLVNIANKGLALSEEKMNAELISEIEHLNVQSQQGQIEHDLEAAKEDIALALLEVQKVLNLDVSEPIEVVSLDAGEYANVIENELKSKENEKEKTEEEQNRDLEELIELSYENRPEFIIQKSKVDAAMYKEKGAVAGWFPHMNLQIERGQKAEAYKQDDNNPPWDMESRIVLDCKWNVVGNTFRYMYDKNRQGTGVEATERAANIGTDGYYDRRNIFTVSFMDGLDQFVNTKEAEISRKEAMLELELAEKDIVREVKESFYNYNRSIIQLRSINKRLAYRKKLVELARHRSEINEIQISEYIQAEIDLINERNNLYNAMVDFFLAKASLNKAVGLKDYSKIGISLPAKQ